MLNHFLFILITSFVAASSYAFDVCGTSLECQQELLAGYHIARNYDGTMASMKHDEAMSYCASIGMHMPSAREVAQLAQGMGAVGISETAKTGYQLIDVKNTDGTIDKFYFSHKGYIRPKGLLGTAMRGFWTDSVVGPAKWSHNYPYNVYGLNGDTGYICLYGRFWYQGGHGVLCLP